MSSECSTDRVELRIPCKPEFVGIVRLNMLGIASRMKFTYDEVEDLRLAVGEACTIAVDRAEKMAANNTTIDIKCEIIGKKLTVYIKDTLCPIDDKQTSLKPTDELDKEGLGALLMELLVDEFKVEQAIEGGTLVTMTKYAG
ncbi:MAG: ATP-binding protein [Armatimonadota bacterium]